LTNTGVSSILGTGRVAYRSRVYGHAVVLIIDVRSGDNNVAAISNVEAIRVKSALGVTSGVVNGHISDSQTARAVDTYRLNGRVLDVEIGDCRIDKAMSIEELGLGLASIAPLTIPPEGTIAVQVGTRGALD
jgi:hypothetical protein